LLKWGFSRSVRRRRSFDSLLLPLWGLLLSALLPRAGGLTCLDFPWVLRLLGLTLEFHVLLLPSSEVYESTEE
jgi:hypothetical protein